MYDFIILQFYTTYIGEGYSHWATCFTCHAVIFRLFIRFSILFYSARISTSQVAPLDFYLHFNCQPILLRILICRCMYICVSVCISSCKFEVLITKHQSMQLNFNYHSCTIWKALRSVFSGFCHGVNEICAVLGILIQCQMAVSCRCLGTTCQSHLQGSSSQRRRFW